MTSLPLSTHRAPAPTVSVVIPTFNRSTLLHNAIESVLKQTYTDYELIVIDDGSTDDTRERLEPYMDQIRYLHQDNRGAGSAQNKGVEVARGQWVSILASDDVWLPTKLERQFEALTTFGKEFGACFTDCTYMGNPRIGLSAFEEAGLESRSEFSVLDDPLKYVLASHPVIYVQSLLVLRSLVEQLGGFDEAMFVAEDTDLLLRLTFRTRFCFVSAPLVSIDRTPNRSVGLMEAFSHRNDRLYACLEYKYRKWLGLPELVDAEVRLRIQDALRDCYYSWAIARLYELRFAGALEMIKETKAMGDSYVTIFFTLLSRTAKKLSRALGR